MPLDPATLNSGTPRTIDGRAYPAHLRPYESFDVDLLPIAIDLEEFGKSRLEAEAAGRGCDSFLVSKWLASATWRGLVERRHAAMGQPMLFGATPLAAIRLADLAAAA